MQQTDNYKKHTATNPIQKLLIDNYHKTLKSTLSKKGIGTILDAGCGEGFTLSFIKDEKIGSKHVGVDFLDRAVEIGRRLHPDLEIKQGSIYALPYKDNSFDMVMATEVLEHLEDPRKGLKELKRVSRQYILLSVPNEPFFILSNLLRGKNLSRLGNDIEHIQHWSFLGFEKFVKSEGLRIVSVKHPFPWTLLLLDKTG